jgi:hypothetical protein
MKKNSVKYLWGINFLQLTIADKTEIKKLGYAIPDLFISHQAEHKLISESSTLLCTLYISG